MSPSAIAQHATDTLRAPLPLRQVVMIYLAEAGYELLGALRSFGFALPFLLLPTAIYLLFGVIIAGNATAADPAAAGIANYLFSGFSAMAVMMPGIFSCALLAQEREARLLALKRALPLPPGAMVVSKVLMSMAVGALAVTPVVLTGLLAGKLSLDSGQVLVIWASLILGSLPFAAIGLMIGAWCSASAAPAWGNLVFLPMIWLSGLFIPLPEFLKPWVVIWPAFHLNQFALGLAGVEGFVFIPPAMAAAVLLGITLICGGIAVRRLARVG
jgi:ABC-2 type transport system permease protein